jgi:3-oxoacyl-[acyl-carrier-protein] synthase III
MRARIDTIEYALPESVLTNSQLSAEFPEWSVGKIQAKTGIDSRHIAASDECASDFAVRAAEKLFDAGAVRKEEIDFALLCTQSPDYRLPTTACLIQDRLGLPTSTGALDFNLGCSGFIYGLGLAKGLIESGQAHNVMLFTAETYSKYINPRDRSIRTIFGDAGAATLIKGVEDCNEHIFPIAYGTDGSGAGNLIVPRGGARASAGVLTPPADENFERSPDDLYMNGSEVFAFTLRRVPDSLSLALKQAKLSLEDVDLFVFHQANAFMLEHLRQKIGIPKEKFFMAMGDIGNTVSATIPIALKRAEQEGALRRGMKVALSGFGVGYSWATCIIEW